MGVYEVLPRSSSAGKYTPSHPVAIGYPRHGGVRSPRQGDAMVRCPRRIPPSWGCTKRPSGCRGGEPIEGKPFSPLPSIPIECPRHGGILCTCQGTRGLRSSRSSSNTRLRSSPGRLPMGRGSPPSLVPGIELQRIIRHCIISVLGGFTVGNSTPTPAQL